MVEEKGVFGLPPISFNPLKALSDVEKILNSLNSIGSDLSKQGLGNSNAVDIALNKLGGARTFSELAEILGGREEEEKKEGGQEKEAAEGLFQLMRDMGISEEEVLKRLKEKI